jgi:hypothetical protein
MSPRVILLALLIVGGFLVGRAVGGMVGREAARTVIRRAEAPPTLRSHVLGELSVDAPRPFARQPAAFDGDAGSGVERLVESSDLFRSSSRDVVVLVARFTYSDGVLVSLDGAASGAMQEMRTAAGVTDFAFTIDTLLRAGLDARRCHATFRINGIPARNESIVLRRGQTLWQVQAMAPDAPGSLQTLERVVNSVALRP